MIINKLCVDELSKLMVSTGPKQVNCNKSGDICTNKQAISGSIHMACDCLMTTGLFQVVNRLVAS